MPKTIAVRFDGEAEQTVDLEAWAADNAEDAQAVATVRALMPGETAKVGGGAAPEVTVRMLDTTEANAAARRAFVAAELTAQHALEGTAPLCRTGGCKRRPGHAGSCQPNVFEAFAADAVTA